MGVGGGWWRGVVSIYIYISGIFLIPDILCSGFCDVVFMCLYPPLSCICFSSFHDNILVFLLSI